MRRGQAMIETVLAVLFITFVFLGLFQLSQMLTARILLDHAAARAARAKAVGFNAFMCRKAARVATIPIAGRRLWPDDLEGASEVSRVPIPVDAERADRARRPAVRALGDARTRRAVESRPRAGGGG